MLNRFGNHIYGLDPRIHLFRASVSAFACFGGGYAVALGNPPKSYSAFPLPRLAYPPSLPILPCVTVGQLLSGSCRIWLIPSGVVHFRRCHLFAFVGANFAIFLSRLAAQLVKISVSRPKSYLGLGLVFTCYQHPWDAAAQRFPLSV